MAKFERIYTAGEAETRTPEQQLIDAITYEGLPSPGAVTLDGKLHRFGVDRTCWYVGYGDGRPAGHFGCWRRGVDIVWRGEGGPVMSAAEEIEHARRVTVLRQERDAELAQSRERAAGVCSTIWESLSPAPPAHPYLTRKGVHPHSARLCPDGRLALPLWDAAGVLSTLQYIDDDGGKRYHPGGQTGGCFEVIGTITPGVIYLAEGFATAATIHEVTGRPCVVAYSASNLVPVAGILTAQYGPQIVVVADNDKGQVGQRAAEQASAKHGVRVVIPPIEGDANDFVAAGNDLAALLADRGAQWLIGADAFSEQPAPVEWLVRGWAQANALIMVHGPSGSGKTFVVLDWCLRMAGGVVEWHGCKVTPGPVVYLAGEGHHGLKGRIKGWKIKHGVDKLDMHLSRSGCDLNTLAGYRHAHDAIAALAKPPAAIVVDTLHRFLLGDENSAQDAKGMLDSCAKLSAAFGCAVILVHHTGVSDEAQHRARGSSAWRGALDIEISVTSKDGIIKIEQRKAKDSEIIKPIHAQLERVTIPGWFDDLKQPVVSAVLAAHDGPPVREKESPGAKHRKAWENAWWASGAEVLDGAPYLTRSALSHYLETSAGWSPANLRQHLKPSAEPGRFLRDLLDCKYLEIAGAGWRVIDPAHATRLNLARIIEVGEGTT